MSVITIERERVMLEPEAPLDPELDAPPRTSRAATWFASRATAALSMGLIAFALRIYAVHSSFDIFIDEVTYTRVAENIAHGHSVTLDGQSFFLHPPAAFALFALVIIGFGLTGSTQRVLLSLRTVTAVLGAAACVGAYCIVERAASRRAALVAGMLVAIDPFIIRFDSRVMLEAPAQAAAAASIGFLASACHSEGDLRRRQLLAAGVFAGLTAATKETFGLVLAFTLITLFVTRWIVTRDEAKRLLVIAAVGYALSVAIVGLTSGFGPWWHEKVQDLERLLGMHQVTGFNSPLTHVTLVSRTFANASLMGASYAVLVFGMLAAVAIVVRAAPWRDSFIPTATERAAVLVAIWTLAAGVYLTYATLFGSIEEQMFYIAALPCAACLCIWCSSAHWPVRPRLRVAVAVALLCCLSFNGVAWVRVHTTKDDEYTKFLAWAPTHIPQGSVVSATENTAQFLLQGVTIGQWRTAQGLHLHHVDYVLISTDLVRQGYGLAKPGFLWFVASRGDLVFQADGPSDGSLRLYDVRSVTDSR